jgi:GNAT superfamily N-acetyltransferase
MNADNGCYLVMSWTDESYVGHSGEPDEYVYETTGDLYRVGENDERELAGKFRVTYIDVDRAANDGMSVSDVFDAHEYIVGYFDALYGSNAPEFDNRVMELLGYDILGSNVLILDRLELLPRYRGRGLGLKVMRHMICRFAAGAAVVAIKPFPLQFEYEPSDEDKRRWRADLGLAQFVKNERVATKKLRDYYSTLGFVRISRTPYMIRGTASPIPELDDD